MWHAVREHTVDWGQLMARVSRILAVATVALVLGAPAEVGAERVATAQKVTVQLNGACADKKMVEKSGETTCTVSVKVTPSSPNRTFTLQEREPGRSASWTVTDKERSNQGQVTFRFSAVIEEDGDEFYRDGAYKFRITTGKTKKLRSLTSASFTITFEPESDDSADEDEDTSTVTTKPKTTTPSKPSGGSTATTPTTPGGGHSPTAPGGGHSPTAPGGGHSPTAPGGGHSPTAPGGGTTPTTPGGMHGGGASSSWFPGGVSAAQMGGYCSAGDPNYATAAACSGVQSQKTLTEFKNLISPLPNAMPSYRRNGFCTQAFMATGATFAQAQTKCTEAGAPSM